MLAHCQLCGLTDKQAQDGVNRGRVPFEEMPVRDHGGEINRAGRTDSVREGRLGGSTSDFFMS